MSCRQKDCWDWEGGGQGGKKKRNATEVFYHVKEV